MELTGKCKEDFKNYLLNDITDFSYKYNYFINLQDSMQYGVYVDFFDSVGIYVMDKHNEVARRFYYDISTKPMSNDITSECNLTRPQARAAAIEKANEIYNSKR
tara:strand:+ start:461 stop:772 length:312 start_codon:yes stop_codon:yes gene_type:complete